MNADTITRRLNTIISEAEAESIADCHQLGIVLGKTLARLAFLAESIADPIMGKIDHLIEKLDAEQPATDDCPPHGTERPVIQYISGDWAQTAAADGSTWWTEYRLPKKGERFVAGEGSHVVEASRDFRYTECNVIVGGPL